MVGDGPLLPNFRKKVKEMQISENVIFDERSCEVISGIDVGAPCQHYIRIDRKVEKEMYLKKLLSVYFHANFRE